MVKCRTCGGSNNPRNAHPLVSGVSVLDSCKTKQRFLDDSEGAKEHRKTVCRCCKCLEATQVVLIGYGGDCQLAGRVDARHLSTLALALCTVFVNDFSLQPGARRHAS